MPRRSPVLRVDSVRLRFDLPLLVVDSHRVLDELRRA